MMYFISKMVYPSFLHMILAFSFINVENDNQCKL